MTNEMESNSIKQTVDNSENGAWRYLLAFIGGSYLSLSGKLLISKYSGRFPGYFLSFSNCLLIFS
jgi:hypothetical protein